MDGESSFKKLNTLYWKIPALIVISAIFVTGFHLWWYFLILQTEVTYGSAGILTGSIGALTALLTVLLALKMVGENKAWCLLILPVLYGILVMTRTAIIMSPIGPQQWPFYGLNDFINSLIYYCGGNLLLLFIALKLNHRLRYVLIASVIVHLLVTSWYLTDNFITLGHVFLIDSHWTGMLGFASIAFAIILMIRDKKEDRYFKLCIVSILAYVVGYSLVTFVSHFLSNALFLELIEPVTVIEQLAFFPLNNVLYLMFLLMILVLSMDEYITDLAERRSRSNALEIAAHMKTDFLENMSRELKTPLTSAFVLGKHSYSMMTEDWKTGDNDPDDLQEKERMVDELRDNLRIIVVESEKMRRIVDGLLIVSTIEQNDFMLHKEYFSIPDLVQEIGEIHFKVLNTNENTLKFSFAPNLPQIYADRDHIQEVVLNLISNAVRHTKNGTIVISAKQEQSSVLLTVTDNGEGIPEDLQKNLFKRFLGTDIGRAQGTGIGLYICKLLIDKHDGSIRLESKPGNGTAVFIKLPIGMVK